MKIDSIVNGIVIDHITAGKAMQLYNLLHLQSVNASVAILMNVVSQKMGRKDIIKIDAQIPVDLDVIGYVDPGATVNFIQDGELLEKKAISLPNRLVNVIRCKNPRCITTTEQELPQIFHLSNREQKVYRCLYCESKAEPVNGPAPADDRVV